MERSLQFLAWAESIASLPVPRVFHVKAICSSQGGFVWLSHNLLHLRGHKYTLQMNSRVGMYPVILFEKYQTVYN